MTVSSEYLGGDEAATSSSVATSNKTYSIYASSAGKVPGANVQVLSPDNLVDKFVAGLNPDKVITLSSPPSPTASFDASDETVKWFQNLDADATGSVTVHDLEAKGIESFEFTLSQPWPLVFSSASDVLLFTFGSTGLVGGDGTGSRIESPGIDPTGNMLTCGLDFVKMEDVTGVKVKHVFTEAYRGNMTDYVPLAILNLEVTLNKPDANAPPRRNALWFVPSADKRLETRLQFQLPQFGALQDLFSITLKGLVVDSADLVYKSTILLALTENGEKPLSDGQVAFSIECSVKSAGTTVSMIAGVKFTPRTIDFTFMFLSPDPLRGILRWLAGLAEDESVETVVEELLNKEENGTKVLPEATLRRLRVRLDTSKDPQNPRLGSFSFDIEVSASFGRGNNTNRTPVFLITYNWDRSIGTYGTLTGQLWNDFSSPDDLDLEPSGEKWAILTPVTTSPAPSIDIATLIPGQRVVNIPDTLPSEITVASIHLSQESFALQCAATARPSSPGSAPQPYLGEVVLSAFFSWGRSSAFTFDVGISVMMDPPEGSEFDIPASFVGSLSYASPDQSWQLKASIHGLYAAVLAEFFDDDAKDHIRPLIRSIAINTLSAEYAYERPQGGTDSSATVGSSFVISGDLVIAGLSLNLNFTYHASGFVFSAALNPENKHAKIGDILTEIFDSELDMPDFVYNTLLVGKNRDAFRIDLQKKTTAVMAVNVESFQFLAQLNIAHIQILFSQLHSTKWGPRDPSKRLFKVGISGFGAMELEIPLVGTLTQPLDELYFLLVHDPKPPRAPGQMTGLTREDIAQFNSGLGDDELLVADKIKPDQAKPSDLLLPSGSHFAVVIRSVTDGRMCLLNYSFMKPQPDSSRALMDSASEGGRRRTEDEMADGGPSAQAPYKKVTGPIVINNVGLSYKDKTLSIVFGATFQLGPIGFSLLGFSFNTQFETLDKLPNIRVSINGLAASFERSPLTIAGVIVHGNDGEMDYYAGGMIIGFRPYQFQAAGFYGIITLRNSSNSFQSVFVFAKLNGPLMTLVFAEISGICSGFGYNSSVRLPSIDQVSNFPFINSSRLSGRDNAQQVLLELVDPSAGGWFQPLDSTYWGAIGMRLSAFRMLSVDAVVAVQFGNSIKLGIFAVATCDIPSANSRLKLAHAELGIATVLDFDYGFLKIEAQLSPRSYILSPNCHLTGGFALCYWFDAPLANKARIGDFIFTLGGYHQAFRVPVGYPNPPRLGISWNLGGGLSISGEAYFAITTKACMAGGRLHAAFRAGPLSAWFDAFANFLINYRPFYFDMSAGVSVGVGFSIDFWFIHIRISVQIGAELYLWGPPVAGRVHVDFWIVAFDINFGDYISKDEHVSLSEFYQLVLQDSPATSLASARALITGESMESQQQSTAAAASSLRRPKNEAHNFLAESGLLNPDDQPERGQEDPWTVRAGTFVFVAECKMAITAVTTSDSGAPILRYNDVFSKPMRLTRSMTSTLQIQIRDEGGSNPNQDWEFERYIQMLPSALWARYDRRTDPRQSGNNVGDLLNTNDGSPPLMTGVRVTAPKPTRSPDPFPAYKVADADLQELTAERPFPAMVTAEDAWAPSKPNPVAKKQYEDVHEAWANPVLEKKGQQGFVAILAQSLGWRDVSELQGIAGIPDKLSKGFMNIYVASPLLAA
ncbi:hypothetical protein FSARC_8671 [Fusarium sarcochroum]|uniref:DUF6603 domain-containing protein n=1 Tax=Fusarium sarcochroum TaxID=1208366 RepID=A0A8H4X638_9HYPO|nr:hypothetical protein FSARC_8671 [Fusarium sarcochroum]